jgi:hypothetical protein
MPTLVQQTIEYPDKLEFEVICSRSGQKEWRSVQSWEPERDTGYPPDDMLTLQQTIMRYYEAGLARDLDHENDACVIQASDRQVVGRDRTKCTYVPDGFKLAGKTRTYLSAKVISIYRYTHLEHITGVVSDLCSKLDRKYPDLLFMSDTVLRNTARYHFYTKKEPAYWNVRRVQACPQCGKIISVPAHIVALSCNHTCDPYNHMDTSF